MYGKQASVKSEASRNMLVGGWSRAESSFEANRRSGLRVACSGHLSNTLLFHLSVTCHDTCHASPS